MAMFTSCIELPKGNQRLILSPEYKKYLPNRKLWSNTDLFDLFILGSLTG